MLVLSLFAVPFVSSDTGGLSALLIGIAFFALGNSMASPALTSLASKAAAEDEQGKTLGILQSAASLARVVGPIICGVLLNNVANQVDSSTLTRTFLTASGIMAIALGTAIYYVISKPKTEFA
jgi:MFS family permease